MITRLTLSFLALFFLTGTARVQAEEPGSLPEQVCATDSPCEYVFCFSSYQEFTMLREELIEDRGLELTEFIPSEPGICFLERIRPTKADLIGSHLTINPRQLTTREILQPELSLIYDDTPSPVRSFRDSVVIRLHQGIRTPRLDSLEPALPTLFSLPSLLQVEGLTKQSTVTPSLSSVFIPAPEIGLLGPLVILGSNRRTDQLKFGPVEVNVPLLSRTGVVRVDRAPMLSLRNGTTSWVIQSDVRGERPIFDCHLRGKDQVFGLIDDLLDLRHCFFEEPGISPGTKHRKIVSYPVDVSLPGSVHGTFTAGILAGSMFGDPANVGNGQAPEAKIAFEPVWAFASAGRTESILYETLKKLYRSGARIFSNSWGDNEDASYSFWARDVDRFNWENEDALVLFAVHNGEELKSPENARNALAIGASRQSGFQERPGAGAPGPTSDGRRKPEILAPGCRIRSAAPDTRCSLRLPPPAHHSYPVLHSFSDRMSNHHSDCATSWACPAVAGAAALVRQHLGTPSGALLKAILLTSTRNMEGVKGDKGEDKDREYPNNIEGWGRIVLDDTLNHDMVTFDVRNRDGFEVTTATAVRSYRISTEASDPLRVTLAWTERPPAKIERSKPVINDLDLHLERADCTKPAACLHLGNDFTKAGISEARQDDLGVFRDAVNNVEQVLIDTPASEYCVSVIARRIHVPPQGYALALSGRNIRILSPTSACPQHRYIQNPDDQVGEHGWPASVN